MFISFAALFSAVILLQLGLGGVAPLDALSGAFLGFSAGQIGALGSAHFLGFLIGCWWTPRLMGAVGHSRAFAAFTAAGVIGILAHMMFVHPWAWMVMRVAVGLSVAGAFTIIEAWLQGKVTNANRGRAMGVYRVVDISSSLVAQLMIAVLDPATYLSYNLLALICCAALFPLVLTRAEAPEIGVAPRLRPQLAWQLSPLASVGVVVSGVTGAAFRMVGPLYGLGVGLPAEQIALFLAAWILGGALAQIPVGWLADRFDRRTVLVWLAAATVLACGLTVLGAKGGSLAIFLSAGFFGVVSFPVYSVSAAHAHDHARQDQRVELSAALMFLYALGAITSPLLVSLLMEWQGPAAMFVFIGIINALLVAFAFWRMRARPSPGDRVAYAYVPRTSFLIGRLIRRERIVPRKIEEPENQSVNQPESQPESRPEGPAPAAKD